MVDDRDAGVEQSSPAMPAAEELPQSVLPPHAEGRPARQSDVMNTKLRLKDVVVLIGSPEMPEHHGVVGIYDGTFASVFGGLAKVTCMHQRPGMGRTKHSPERFYMAPRSLRALQPHEIRRLVVSRSQPRTLVSSELLLIGMPASVAASSTGERVIPGSWTPRPVGK